MRPNLLRRLIHRRDERRPDPNAQGGSVINSHPLRLAGDRQHRKNDGDEMAVYPSHTTGGNTVGIAYFTRDHRLFELAAENWRLNAGLGASIIREAALRDVVTEEVHFVAGARIAAYEPVTTTST